jgi:hypothetical protein
MIIYSYFGAEKEKLLSEFTDDSPIQFLPGFTEFYNSYFHNEVKIIYSEKNEAFIPVRYFRVKMFRFAQILHAPVRDNKELSAADQQVFFEELLQFHRNNELCQRFIQPHPFGILKAVPRGAQSCPFGTYINNLSALSEDQILTSFDPKYRKSVNHAEKNGAVVRFGKDQFENFYSLYKNTTTRAGIHCDPVEYFNKLFKTVGENHVETGVVYDQEIPVGAILILYSKYSALCTHAGSGGESKLYGAMKMLHYYMMKRMKQKNVRFYDLVGVRINSNNEALEGIFRFKKGFGGELKEGYLWKADIAPLQTKMFDMMMRLRNPNKKFSDIIDEETA